MTEPTSWQDIDDLLARIAELQRTLDRENVRLDEEVSAARERHTRMTRPAHQELCALKGLIEDYVLEHEDELEGTGKRSIQLIHGRVGLARTPGKVSFPGGENTAVKLLKMHGHIECVKTQERVDKNLAKRLVAAELKLCGISLVTEDRFVLELRKS